MVKNGVKGLKKAKILEDKSKVMSEMVTENAYIAELLSIVNFPKREDSDNDDGKILIFLL